MKLAAASIIILCACRGSAANPCGACHPQHVERHAVSSHARSLRPILDSDFYRALPERPLGEAPGGFLLSYSRNGEAVNVTSELDGRRGSGLIEWAFGAGDQAVTPIALVNGQYLEHRVSYFTRVQRFGLTLGHQPGISVSSVDAIGISQPPEVIRQCFGCHSTNVSSDLKSVAAGVGCARCHVGAEAHAEGKGKVQNPGKLEPSAVVVFCAECHRLSPPGDADDPFNVRFQPWGLTRSQCYKRAGLTCLTCHEPHADARENDPEFYRSRCLSCHSSQDAKPDCLPCHMPKQAPHPHLSFTDHYIRIVKVKR